MKGDDRSDDGGGHWLTYRELAERLGITLEAAQQKARRGRWPRQDGNDGRRLVLVPIAALSPPPTDGDDTRQRSPRDWAEAEHAAERREWRAAIEAAGKRTDQAFALVRDLADRLTAAEAVRRKEAEEHA